MDVPTTVQKKILCIVGPRGAGPNPKLCDAAATICDAGKSEQFCWKVLPSYPVSRAVKYSIKAIVALEKSVLQVTRNSVLA